MIDDLAELERRENEIIEEINALRWADDERWGREQKDGREGHHGGSDSQPEIGASGIISDKIHRS